jgi:myo-inositol-1(or 4)-monophosphatase
VVDPIDGTRAYVKDQPWFSVCIAVVEDGAVTHGVVQAPALRETFTAERGGGAWLNGTAIRASATAVLDDAAMLAYPGLFTHKSWKRPWPAMRVESRNSIAYRMCLVADGRFDAAVALNIKHDWDVAASSLIAAEAGAWVGDHKGEGYAFNRAEAFQPSLVCAAPALAPLILERTAAIDLPRAA